MQADKIQSAVLECMTQIPMVAALGDQRYDWVSEQLSFMGIQENIFDFNRLRLMAGFIARVRHNNLNRILPMSMSFMLQSDLDFLIFPKYAGTYLQLKLNPQFNEQVQLIEFKKQVYSALEENLKTTQAWKLKILVDLIHYELCLNKQTESANISAQHSSYNNTAKGLPPSAPRVLGINKFNYHPQILINTLGMGQAELVKLEPTNTLFVILRGEDDTVEVLEIDAITAALLSTINGDHSIGDISTILDRSYGFNLSNSNICELLEQLANANLINFSIEQMD